ncbi:polysaccharide pyruvyl transferase family protein [Chitinophaga sp. 30R24]|uniref:polysaccharide pyruvyl transferase family protein n=1 Tax=Chitinophaga sp. 30R24 TaxID=3248838 RepID=UPI003B900A9E
MKKALIINEGFSNNLGDQAIRESMMALLQDHHIHTDFAYFTNPGMPGLPVYNYLGATAGAITPPALSLRKKTRLKLVWLYWIGINFKYIRTKLQQGNYDMIVIGGGQLIESSGKNYPSRFAIALYWWTFLAKKYSRAKIYLIGVGVGTTFNKKEQQLFAKALAKADLIWVRDTFSQASLQEKFGHKAWLTPDIAFYNEQNKIVGQPAMKKALVGITSYNEVFAKYNLPGKTSTDYYEEWWAVVKDYMSQGLLVELFYTTLSDAAETMAFRDYVQQHYQLALPVASLASVKDLSVLYQSASEVYSGRMHALILAMKHRCNVKAYLISQKLKSFHQEYILPGNQPVEYSRKIKGAFHELLEHNVK